MLSNSTKLQFFFFYLVLGPLSYITLVPVMFVTTFNDYKKDLLFFFLLCVNLLGLVFCVFFFFY